MQRTTYLFLSVCLLALPSLLGCSRAKSILPTAATEEEELDMRTDAQKVQQEEMAHQRRRYKS